MGKNDARQKTKYVSFRLDVQLFSRVIDQWESLFGAPRLEKELFIVGDEEGSTLSRCAIERWNLRKHWMRRASVGLSRGWEKALGKPARANTGAKY